MGYEKTGPYALTDDPPVWDDFRRVLAAAGLKLELKPIEKWDFYTAVVHAGPRADRFRPPTSSASPTCC